MILTLTVNPLLEKRLYFDNSEKGAVNRCSAEHFYAGGKGINVSRQLSKLGIDNLALTFAGGTNGKILRHVLGEEGINFSLVNTKAETRGATLLLEKESPKITSYIGLNCEITDEEVKEFNKKLDKMIQNASIVVITGSLPSENTAEIFFNALNLAAKHDKMVIIDTYGPHLQECIKLAPFAVHNNITELENSFNKDLSSEENIFTLLDEFYSRGVKMSFISNGDRPFYTSKFDFHYLVTPPKIREKDPLGSGDAFVAGVTYGLVKNLVYNDIVKTATSLGAVNAEKWSTSEVAPEEIERYYNQVEIKQIGKKMKLIDDTPRY